MLLVQQYLTRVFTVQFNSGLAFLAISTTFLGLGSAGVCVYAFPSSMRRERMHRRLPWLALAYALALVCGFIALVATDASPQLGAEPSGLSSQVQRVLFAALWMLPALFLVGLVISLILVEHSTRVHRLYGADLAGGGIGCLLVLPLMNGLGGDQAIFAVGFLAALGAALLAHAHGVNSARAAAVLVALALACGPYVNRDLSVVDVRSHRSPLSGVENWVKEDVEVARDWNALSRLGFFETTDGGSIYVRIDSSCQTTIPSQDPAQRKAYVDATDFERLPFVLDRHRRCLEIGAGGGRGMVLAEAMGAEHITGVEINPGIVAAALHGFPGFGPAPLLAGGAHRYIAAEGRGWALGTRERFDSVTITFIQTGVASSSAAFALSEANLFTVEAFRGFVDLLDADGLFYVYRHGGNECLRMISMAREVLGSLGIADFGAHLFIARNDTNRLVMLLARSPLRDAEIDRLESACKDLDVEVLWSPRSKLPTRPENPLLARWEELRRSGRLEMRQVVDVFKASTRDATVEPIEATYIRSSDPQSFQDDYLIDISAPRDDRPYFFFTGINKLRDFGLYFDLAGVGILGGTVVLLFWMAAAFAVLVTLLILAPMFLRRAGRGAGRQALWVVSYFSGLGLGYMAVQISFIQRFTLFLGHPVYAISIVLLAFLVSSGLGSACSDRLHASFLGGPLRVIGLLALLLVAYNALLPRVFQSSLIALPLTTKIAITVGLILPLAFLMGSLFPRGIRLVDRAAKDLTPWAWGVNSAASVLGSIVALVLAIHFGFSAVALLGAATYLLLCVPAARALDRFR